MPSTNRPPTVPARDGAQLEPLERRVFLCADHLGAALPAELRDYLNALPDGSPMPFDYAEYGHGGAGDLGPEAGGPGGGGQAGLMAGDGNGVTTILDSGPSANRVDIVLVGDGYTAADLPAYYAHADNVLAGFFAQAPFSIYRSFFNVHRVDVISAESGVDNDPAQGVLRNTALDMAYWCNGVERLLCVNTSKARNQALRAPAVDQTLAIANSSKYGGAGYPSQNLGTLAGGNGLALEIALHEFGHSFADLADEYDYGGPANWPGGEPGEANVTVFTAAQLAAQQRKWYRWLDHPAVDTFEGANYSRFGIYRPTADSKMRSLNRPWDPVNTEQLILSAYETVRPIDAATAAGSYPGTASFFVDPVDPVGNPLAVRWLLDGQVIPGATGLTFDAAPLLLDGTHTLEVEVQDQTTLVRDEGARATLMTQRRAWTLLDAVAPRVTGAAFDVDAPAMRMAFTFSEALADAPTAADFAVVNLTTGQAVSPGQLNVAWDAGARTAYVTFPGFAAGVLPDGNYAATLAAGSVHDAAGNALAADAGLDFFALAGDATRDRAVDVADFAVLRANFGAAGTVFSQGNFNYDAVVNAADFAILRAQFGLVLPPPGGNLFGGGGAGEGGGDTGGDELLA